MRDDWTDETVSGRRTGPVHEGAGDRSRSEMAAVPTYVWVLGILVVLMLAVICGLWGVYLLRGQLGIGGPTPTPVIWTPTAAPSATLSPTATAGPPPTLSPEVSIGRYVRVAGTEGLGLSLRSGPGESYVRMDVALEGEVFVVVEGPSVIAGSPWFKIRDPDNVEREWWAVGNYLQPVEQ
jgi:hypothetical protein